MRRFLDTAKGTIDKVQGILKEGNSIIQVKII